MPRENSFSDSDGRSLTPDLDEEQQRFEVPGEEPNTSNALNVQTVPARAQSPHHSILQSLRSLKSPKSAASHHTNRPPIPPLVRFRAIVRKVIQLHRSTTIIASRGIGAEPGIDPRRHSANVTYGHIKENCLIEIVDYSSVRCSEGRMGNQEFVNLLNNPEASKRDPWVKVRWINVGGVSWDVISALAIKYDLHPLALEDVLHQRDQNRSKADYYSKHLFLRVLCHTLADEDEFVPQFAQNMPSNVTNLPRSASPTTFGEVDRKVHGYSLDNPEGELEGTMYDESNGYGEGKDTMSKKRNSMGYLRKRPTLNRDVESSPPTLAKGLAMTRNMASIGATRASAEQKLRIKEEMTIEELKKGSRVHVKVSPMYIFLLRDGTVISISRKAGNLDLTTPISARLRQRDTGLRTSADPSLLVQSLLDLIVDEAMEVIDEYQGKILKLEHKVLLKPNMKTVRQLHILSGDLILHKRTLEPIRVMIYGLRRYDTDRCAALIEGPVDSSKVVGFMSHKSKIYLADVHDHMEYILTSLDMFTGIAENLINYTFNMASYEMNEVMRRLTLATIIFLPLTLLTGYFGMNFDNMWSVKHGHTDLVFWIIAIPVMLIVIPMFLYQDFERMFHYAAKKWSVKRVVKEKSA
jgi:Mg2+ and Co2+ transporter CorA